jgi:ABC-2 type transport system permease protein
LLSPEAEARAFWRVRWKQVACVGRQALAEARLRVSLILVLSSLLWVGLFWLFWEGFEFMDQMIMAPDLHDRTVQAVFGMFFVALMVMLVFSTGVLLYGSLFRARDLPLLLTLPVRVERVFLHKFQEAILMSSWAFLLLGSPMLLAYGIVAEAPWYYYAMLLPFLLAFVYIPAALGSILCLLIVYRLPRGQVALMVFAGLAILGGLGLLVWSIISAPSNDLLTPDWFQEMLGRMRITEHRLLPSWWLSAGLLQSAAGELSESILFLTLMISNALFLRLVAISTAGRIYRKAYHRLHGRPGLRRKVRVSWLDRITTRLTARLPREVRLLIVKDVRLFRRDPVQWTQFLVFFGLLTLYFINVRRFSYDMYHIGWVSIVSFLNVSVVGLLLSAFTTRFVFPMISLEGRRFWILGLLPVRRETILWSKLWFAVGGSILPCAGLIFLSDIMLRITPWIVACHQLTCVILCFGLSGISVGLGAKMPSFRETSPSKISAGFGGTLTLVVSTLFIVAVVLLITLPAHFYFTPGNLPTTSALGGRVQVGTIIQFWFFAGTAGGVLLGIVATIVPMRLGARAFRTMEL